MRWTNDRRFTQTSIDFIGSQWHRGSRHLAQQKMRWHLSRPEHKRDAAQRVLCGYEDQLHAYPSIGEIHAVAEQIHPFRQCNTAIPWRREPKATRGHRVVCMLPPVWEATHMMIGDILRVTLPNLPHLTDVRKRGRDRIALEIRAALEQGYEYCFVGDLTDCFQSVNPEGLYETLPLPRAVIEHALDSRNITFERLPRSGPSTSRADAHAIHGSPVSGGSYASSEYSVSIDPRRMGPRGLVTGSPASNLILSWLFASMPNDLPHGVPAYISADNVLVAGHTEQECRLIEHTLAEYFSAHPAGPFVFGQNEIVSAREGFEFLGYSFRKLRSGQVRVEIGHKKTDEIWGGFLGLLQDDEARWPYPVGAEHYLRAKLGGFTAVTGIDEFRDELIFLATEYLQGEERALSQIDLLWLERLHMSGNLTSTAVWY